MDLREAFETALRPEEYDRLLSDEQRGLHALQERRAKIDPEAIEAVRGSDLVRGLVITEPWCGDSLAILPVVIALFGGAGCEVRIVRRDEHLDLIDRYLTNGGRAIPIVIGLDGEYEEIFHWGPRPAPAQRILEEARADLAAGRISKAEIHKRIRACYSKDRGRTIVEELTGELLSQ